MKSIIFFVCAVICILPGGKLMMLLIFYFIELINNIFLLINLRDLGYLFLLRTDDPAF